MNILSVSRRTDIPAYYSNWFKERVLSGNVNVYNTECGGVINVPLNREYVDRFVFWSRNYKPFINSCLPLLKEYDCKYHFTITGLPKIFEKNTPSVDEAIETFKILSNTVGASNVYWRFDPIVVTVLTPVAEIIRSFKYIAEKLHGYTNLCIAGFVKEYEDVLDRLPSPLIKLSRAERIVLLNTLNNIAKSHGITLRVAQLDEAIHNAEGTERVVDAATCVEGGELHKIVSGQHIDDECACEATIDLGSYDSCPAECAYCFANTDFEKSILRRQEHGNNQQGLPLPMRNLMKQTPKLDPALQTIHKVFSSCEPCPVACSKRRVDLPVTGGIIASSIGTLKRVAVV